MKYLIFLSLIMVSCAGSDGIRYDSNSDRYKRQHGIQMNSPKVKSGPNSGKYHNR